jgi:5-methylcytosine-specific restriction endonuclease McrA
MKKYQKYLISKKWKNKRKEILEKQDYCSFCFSNKIIHIHHSKYRDKNGFVLGREKHKILFPLCASCHNKWHKYHDKPLNSSMVKRANAMFFEGISLDDCIRFCFDGNLFKHILFSWRADMKKEKSYKYQNIKLALSGKR